MIQIIPTILATKTGLEMLQRAKEWFYPDKNIKEAEDLLRKRMADDLGSLQEQIRNHREVMDKLVDQVKADKEMIEKHNEVMIQLSQAAEQTAIAHANLRFLCFSAIGVAGLALVGVIVLFFRL
jgi:hypothetical protein